MQFDAQDTRVPPGQPRRLLRRDRGRRSSRRAAVRRPPPRRPAHRRHRAAAGVPRPRHRRWADRRAAAGGRRRRADRQHPRRGAQPARPGSTSGSASWSPPTSASTDGWSGRRERRAVRRTPPGSASRRLGRADRHQEQVEVAEARRGRGRRSPAAAPARAGPRKTSENCSRSCPSGPVPPRSVLSVASASSIGIGGMPSPLTTNCSPTRPSKRSKVSHLGSVTRRCYSP